VGSPTVSAKSSIKQAYERRKEEFARRALELGYRQALKYIWYHTINLGNGLLTPGVYDYRETLSAFHFPEDMHGMRVLDIGSATGFFAFEFERRGAEVTSVELPSLKQLDRFPGQSTDELIVKIQRMQFPRRPGGLESYDQHYFSGTDVSLLTRWTVSLLQTPPQVESKTALFDHL
jgi:SAM-dependent methyltransferase